MLDIAAGHGLFGIEVAKQSPQARIVAVDWAQALEVAKRNAENAGVANRYQTLPGSAFDVEFGGPYDIVLLTNFLHHFDAPTCVRLLKKVHAATKRGGRVATLEFVPNADRVSPPMAAAFSLTMLATTASGDAYTFRELESMYREAGFERISAQPVQRTAHHRGRTAGITAHVRGGEFVWVRLVWPWRPGMPPARTGHNLTIWCFLTHSGSKSTPNPGPVGTLIFPSTTFNGEVLHSNRTCVCRPLNS